MLLEITGKPHTWEEVTAIIRYWDAEFLEYMDGIRQAQVEDYGVDYSPDEMLISFWANRCDRIEDRMLLKGQYLLQFVTSEFADMETEAYTNLQTAMAQLAEMTTIYTSDDFSASVTYERFPDGELFHVLNYFPSAGWQVSQDRIIQEE